MCGSVSAVGLQERERELWPYLRERLREPGRFMALMRGVLGDAEVGVVVSVTPEGAVKPLAVLTTAEAIAAEIELGDDAGPPGLRRAKVGDYDAEILVREGLGGQPEPIAILSTPWIEQHLLLYARTLWHRR